MMMHDDSNSIRINIFGMSTYFPGVSDSELPRLCEKKCHKSEHV
jgi:hypothetical protein